MFPCFLWDFWPCIIDILYYPVSINRTTDILPLATWDLIGIKRPTWAVYRDAAPGDERLLVAAAEALGKHIIGDI